MGRECEVSGKKTSFGNHITTRGKAKYLGGVGKKTTGVSRRTFKPNLQWIHVWLPNGTTRYVRVATSVIRSGQLTLEVDGKQNADAAWFYPDASEKAKSIEGYVAFWRGVDVER